MLSESLRTLNQMDRASGQETARALLTASSLRANSPDCSKRHLQDASRARASLHAIKPGANLLRAEVPVIALGKLIYALCAGLIAMLLAANEGKGPQCSAARLCIGAGEPTAVATDPIRGDAAWN
jgi:hypothetical protein